MYTHLYELILMIFVFEELAVSASHDTTCATVQLQLFSCMHTAHEQFVVVIIVVVAAAATAAIFVAGFSFLQGVVFGQL